MTGVQEEILELVEIKLSLERKAMLIKSNDR